MRASLVCFVCWVNHSPLQRGRGGAVLVDQLQIHEKKWAYCGAGGKTDHVWEAIEPLSITDVKLYERHLRETSG